MFTDAGHETLNANSYTAWFVNVTERYIFLRSPANRRITKKCV
jgi:hypothetical protein